MKTYKIKVTLFDRPSKILQATKDKLIKAGNVNQYVFKKLGALTYQIHKIEVLQYNKNTKHHYKELTFDFQLEQWRNDHKRIEAVNAPGYEDYTGYGNKTDGKINRFYLGKSTGWVPIYLEILKSNSSGGSALFTHKRTFRAID
jgi:hypothetical protein